MPIHGQPERKGFKPLCALAQTDFEPLYIFRIQRNSVESDGIVWNLKTAKKPRKHRNFPEFYFPDISKTQVFIGVAESVRISG